MSAVRDEVSRLSSLYADQQALRLPPHSIALVVDGGDAMAIAEAVSISFFIELSYLMILHNTQSHSRSDMSCAYWAMIALRMVSALCRIMSI